MRTKIATCLVLVTCLLAPPAQAQDLDAKQQEAEALRARIAEQGERLSMADEDYNEAKLRSTLLERELGEIASEVAAAEGRWRDLRDRLGTRVRALYMHPGAALDAFLGIRSFDDAARAATLSASVLTADTELIDHTSQARTDLEGQMDALTSARAEVRRTEEELAAKRLTVEEGLREQRALLGQVEGEIAEVVEAQRQRELEEAARLAAEEAARAQAQQAAEAQAPAEESAAADGAEGLAATPDAAAPDAAAPDGSEAEPAPDPGAPSSAASKAVQTARAQIGKPYEWAAEGPNSFDCSGLTMYAWQAAGVSLPHSSRAQFATVRKVPRSQIRPGDLLFFGSPIHHVGIYEGRGVMINAPQTGENVRRDSIGRSDFAGAGRPG